MGQPIPQSFRLQCVLADNRLGFANGIYGRSKAFFIKGSRNVKVNFENLHIWEISQ